MDSLEEKLKQALDEKADALNASTLSRLHRARTQALEATPPWWRRLAASNSITIRLEEVLTSHPTTVTAAAVAMALSVFLLLPHITGSNKFPNVASTETLDVMEIMELDVDLELVEDLDFYDWLEGQLNEGSGV
jgi:hypothetical protein